MAHIENYRNNKDPRFNTNPTGGLTDATAQLEMYVDDKGIDVTSLNDIPMLRIDDNVTPIIKATTEQESEQYLRYFVQQMVSYFFEVAPTLRHRIFKYGNHATLKEDGSPVGILDLEMEKKAVQLVNALSGFQFSSYGEENGRVSAQIGQGTNEVSIDSLDGSRALEEFTDEGATTIAVKYLKDSMYISPSDVPYDQRYEYVAAILLQPRGNAIVALPYFNPDIDALTTVRIHIQKNHNDVGGFCYKELPPVTENAAKMRDTDPVKIKERETDRELFLHHETNTHEPEIDSRNRFSKATVIWKHPKEGGLYGNESDFAGRLLTTMRSKNIRVTMPGVTNWHMANVTHDRAVLLIGDTLKTALENYDAGLAAATLGGGTIQIYSREETVFLLVGGDELISRIINAITTVENELDAQQYENSIIYDTSQQLYRTNSILQGLKEAWEGIKDWLNTSNRES